MAELDRVRSSTLEVWHLWGQGLMCFQDFLSVLISFSVPDCQGMLSSPQAAVRVRAFDLVLNLGVHAHLLEPMQSEDQTSLEDGNQPSRGSFSSILSAGDAPVGERERPFEENGSDKGSLEKPERGTPAAVGIFEAWLLDIVCEMLLFLVQVCRELSIVV